MFASLMRSTVRLSLAGAAVLLGGCTSVESATAPCDDLACGGCAGIAGLPMPAACADAACAAGVDCDEVVTVAASADLAATAAGATPGTCLVLAPGAYGPVEVPGGVRLLGSDVAAVRVAGVTLGPGDGAGIRGLTVGSGGVTVAGATRARIEAVLVAGSAGEGIVIQPGSSVEIVSCEVRGAGRSGILVQDAAVAIDRTVVSGSEGPGIWAEGPSCDVACDACTRPALRVTDSIFQGNRIVGIGMASTAATLACVDVTGTRPGDAFFYSQFGGGISAAACSSLDARGLRVLDNVDWGVLVDHSRATLGGPTPGDGVEISRNLRGLWIQDVTAEACADPPCVVLDSGLLWSNRGVGIGVARHSWGVVIRATRIADTQAVVLPIDDPNNLGGSAVVGDAFEWLGASEVSIEGLRLGGSARRGVLIDGPVGAGGSRIHALDTAGEAPALRAVLQQAFTGGLQPEVDGSVVLMTAEGVVDAVAEGGEPAGAP
jgi:hypothetical protein